MRLKGLGMPVYGKPTQTGDAYVRLLIETPKNLSEEEKSLFNQLLALQNK